MSDIAGRVYYVRVKRRKFCTGERISWQRDHLGARQRTGIVAGMGVRYVWVWPDDNNYGPEHNGGTSEIDIEDVTGVGVVSL